MPCNYHLRALAVFKVKKVFAPLARHPHGVQYIAISERRPTDGTEGQKAFGFISDDGLQRVKWSFYDGSGPHVTDGIVALVHA